MFRAVLFGSIISAFLSSALVLAGLRAGITPGVSPLIVLLGWVLFFPEKSKAKSPFLLILQTTGSAGAAVTAGVIFTAPILQIAAPEGVAPAVSIPLLVISSLAGALLGWGCVGLNSRKMIFDLRLPAPEAVACNELLEAADLDATNVPTDDLVDVSEEAREQRPGLIRSLFVPGLLSTASTVGVMLGVMRDKLFEIKIYSASVPLPVSPLYLGIGAILSLETAILLAVGGLGHATVRAVSHELSLDNDTFRWLGAAAMTISILYALANYTVEQWHKYQGSVSSEEEPLSEYYKLGFMFALVLGLLIAVVPQLGDYSQLSVDFFSKMVIVGIVFVLVALALSAIGALLSLQVGSSASPVSGTVFVGMLCLALTFSVFFKNPSLESLVYLLVALCVSICAANDSSQDYRTLLLRKYPLSVGYIPQLCGLLAAVAVVPATLWLAHDTFYLGSEALPAPQASFFSVVLLGLLEDGGKPIAAIMIGAVIGLLAVAVECWGKRRNRQLSSVSFCVGLYLPPVIGIGILIGALIRYFGLSAGSKQISSSGLLAAAAFISLDAAVTLGFGFANILGYWAVGNTVFEPQLWFSWAIFGLLCFSLYSNFRKS